MSLCLICAFHLSAASYAYCLLKRKKGNYTFYHVCFDVNMYRFCIFKRQHIKKNVDVNKSIIRPKCTNISEIFCNAFGNLV